MRITCAIAANQEATRLTNVTQADIDGCIYASPAHPTFAAKMADVAHRFAGRDAVELAAALAGRTRPPDAQVIVTAGRQVFAAAQANGTLDRRGSTARKTALRRL